MPEDSRILIILRRPFLATAQAMIDVFNKKITLRVGDDEVIFDVDQSIKRPPAKDDECYGIDDLDDTINIEAQELLKNDEFDSFLLKFLEKSINQSVLESCDSIGDKFGDNSDLGTLIRCIDPTNTPYLDTQKTIGSDGVKSEHLYSTSANAIDEKKPELKDLPHHLEYAYLHDNKSFPIIILSKLSKKEKKLLLQQNPSSWVSPIHVVPKKGGMIVVLNDNNELIPSRTVIGWRVMLARYRIRTKITRRTVKKRANKDTRTEERARAERPKVRIVISKALIGSPKQLSYVEEGKHKRKLRFALISLTQQAQEHHTDCHIGNPCESQDLIKRATNETPMIDGMYGYD
ncbi:hypothetical protein Tco_0945330 [Tanacetum coccineum]